MMEPLAEGDTEDIEEEPETPTIVEAAVMPPIASGVESLSRAVWTGEVRVAGHPPISNSQSPLLRILR